MRVSKTDIAADSAGLISRMHRHHPGSGGPPTVVIEAGADRCGRHSSPGSTITASWARVLRQVQKTTRICLHDRRRLGSGRGTLLHTSQDRVDDLRTFLRESGIAPPYVLVGHSIGGFNVRLFAHQYPAEVAGLVLVDSAHPDQLARLSEFLQGPPSGTFVTPEGFDVRTSAEQVRKTKTLGIKPVVVLTRSQRAVKPAGIPTWVFLKMQTVWRELQIDLLNLSANSSLVTANRAGHHIQLDEPRLVVEAILKVVREIQARRFVVH